MDAMDVDDHILKILHEKENVFLTVAEDLEVRQGLGKLIQDSHIRRLECRRKREARKKERHEAGSNAD